MTDIQTIMALADRYAEAEANLAVADCLVHHVERDAAREALRVAVEQALARAGVPWI